MHILHSSSFNSNMAAVSTQTIGFPRIGSKRQMKVALESYWKGKLTQEELLKVAADVEVEALTAQKVASITRVGLDGTLYDQMLDVAYIMGVAPARFQNLKGLDQYFAMARGADNALALDMSKYLDTNYHYLVPELEANFATKPNFGAFLDKVARGQEVLGAAAAIPMIVGPVTFVLLAKREVDAAEALDRLLPAYAQLLRKLQGAGAPEVQIHEPVLATEKGAAARELFESAYTALAAVGCPIDLVAPYDDIGAAYPWAVALPVAAISLDFCGVPGALAPNQTLNLIKTHGFPANKRLGAGIIDGRSVWADDAAGAAATVAALRGAGVANLSVQPSVSLQHLPFDASVETGLPAGVRERLAFALQKLATIREVAEAAASGDRAGAKALADPPMSLDAALFKRPESFGARRPKQLQFPAFPTTSIGSFPQTAEVRRLRLQYNKGTLSREQYERLIDLQIAYAMGIQDALDIDVPVHGEAERTDMVEYFGQNLEGLAFTTMGWVQSYGSRYVRPPIIFGDVEFTAPMTVREFQVAQSLTTRPVKGMLTGPVTILNWSFPRKDLSRRAQAFQLALALRKEVAALEAAGCRIIQVDEPALREGLPLKRERWEGYLTWAVDAFRLCTAVAAPETQVVTHLCYSDFQDIMPAIDAMDADVLTIENSRSGDEMVRALAAAKYSRDLGPGVYDVHSPLVPSVEFMVEKLQTFVDTGILKGHLDRIWANPDCGLKTRTWDEVIPSLRNMVAAAKHMRAKVSGGAAPPAPASAAAGGAAAGGGSHAACCGGAQ